MKTTNKLPPIIIDTDPGHDDAMAIMLLIKSCLFDVKAITTVAGNASIQDVTNNARYILDLLDSNVPLYSGEAKPLRRKQIMAQVHGKGGLAGANITKTEPLNHQAVNQIIRIVRENPHEVSIVIVGAETNIAKAFIKDPELPKLIKQLVIMGGTIDAPGNKSASAEFNIYCDPEAANVVFSSGAKIILNPLDVANNMPMFLEEFERLKGSKLYKPIISMMKHFIKGIKKFELAKGALMYDPLAAYYLVNPKAYKITNMEVHVETKGEYTYGMTVADRRAWGKKNPNVSVITSIDRKSFVNDFIKIIRSQ